MVNSRRVSFKMVQSFNSSGTLLALKCVWRSLRQRSHAPLSIYRPQLTVDNISQIDWKALRNNDGVCQLIFDKDNCLTLPYSPQIYPPFMVCYSHMCVYYMIVLLSVGGMARM
jgi:hypothetical protein